MPTAKVAVTIDVQLLREVDSWVAAGEFPNRSQAVQSALAQLREQRTRHSSLLRELAKADPAEERALAEEWLIGEAPWPEYCGARSIGRILSQFAGTSREADDRSWC